ncbi:MAG TPA: glycosyltransferase family 39 protein [Terriglobales bacterium]|nr:glycosyltransferase family 39 protein [Terriglobales bacterium]
MATSDQTSSVPAPHTFSGTGYYNPKRLAVGTRAGWTVTVCAFAILLGVTVALQWWAGAYRSDLGLHPDESAHYVTGLMVHDYLWLHPKGSPLVFVEQYYGHYPKVAIGHWPPVSYAVQGVWSLLFSPSISSVLLLMATISALLGAVVADVVSRSQTLVLGMLAGLLLIANPIAAQASIMIMADGLLALLILAATLVFLRYIDGQHRVRYSLAFVLLASLALLTKGGGLALAFVPPLTLILLRRWHVFRWPSLWLSGMAVVLFCAPWYWFTRSMQAGSWVSPHPTVSYTVSAIQSYSHDAYASLGLLGTVLALLGIGKVLSTLRTRQHPNVVGVGMFALLVGVLVIACGLPVGVERRFLLPALPALVYFVAQGACWVAEWCATRIQAAAGYERAFSGGLVALVLVLCFHPVHKEFSGFSSMAKAMVEDPSPEYPAVLIASDALGEGMFVADMATFRSKHDSIVVRGTKTLAETDWLGTEYKTPYNTPRAVFDRVDELPVNYVLDDHSVNPNSLFRYQKLLEQAIAEYPEHFKLLGKFTVTRNGMQYPDSVYLYRVLHTTAPSQILRLSMWRMLHSDIEIIVPESRQSSILYEGVGTDVADARNRWESSPR